MKYEHSVEYQLQQRGFDYPGVIETLRQLPRPLTPEELGMLGTSQFRLGLFAEAEPNLLAAKHGGCLEAEIELQGCRMALLKFDLAREDLETLVRRTEGQGFLHSMALRWAGVTETVVGNVITGTGLLSQAYREFQAVGNARGMQITANMLGAALILRGDLEKAEYYVRRSLALSTPGTEPAIWIDTGIKLFMMCALTDRPGEAREAVELMKRASGHVSPQASGYFDIQIRLCETVLHRLHDNKWAFAKSLLKLHPLLLDKQQRHIEALLWLGPLLLDSISRVGQHRVALGIIRRLLPDRSLRPVVIQVVESVIQLRNGGYKAAVHNLQETLAAASANGQRIDAIRCQLYLADALYKSGKPDEAVEHLNAALHSLAHISPNFLIRDDLDAIKSVLLYGQSKGDTARLLQIVRGSAPAPERHVLQLQTFGRLTLEEDGQPRCWTLADQPVLLILTFLKARPGSTVDQIAREVLSEKYLESREAAHSYVRQAIMQLRQRFGKECLLARQERKAAPARYYVNDELVLRLDVDAAYDALAEGDLAGLFEVYQGRFAAALDSAYAASVNDDIEGAVYQYLAARFAGAEGLSELHDLDRWVRLLLSVAPEHDAAVQLGEDIDAAIQAASGQDLPALDTPYNF